MLYTALLYTPGKEHTRYLVDFDLDALAERVRWQARPLGVARVSDLIAVTDGGNGLEEALQRHLAEDLTTILDWHHAAEHLCDFTKVWHADDEAARQRWQAETKGILYEQGGEALLSSLQALALPAGASALMREELRKLIGYFTNNRHRTDYPSYRRKGWDIGSGPTEASCKIIGERLKGSGMRWVEDGAVTVASLRALYVSGGKIWDGFWSQPRRRVLAADQKCSAAAKTRRRPDCEAHNRALLRVAMMGTPIMRPQEAPRCTPTWSYGVRFVAVF